MYNFKKGVMVYIGSDKEIYLTKFDNLGRIPIQQQELDALRSIQEWVFDYLCKPHPKLGRKGNVCPFTLSSARKKHFWIGCYTPVVGTISNICESLRKCIDIFHQTEPMNEPESILKTFVVVFPNITAAETELLIDYTHELLKPDFVRSGLMLGQFHADCKVGGVHNSEFRSLYSPIPLFVIRNMVVDDFLFLQHEETFLNDYVEHCSKAYPKRFSSYMKAVAERTK